MTRTCSECPKAPRTPQAKTCSIVCANARHGRLRKEGLAKAQLEVCPYCGNPVPLKLSGMPRVTCGHPSCRWQHKLAANPPSIAARRAKPAEAPDTWHLDVLVTLRRMRLEREAEMEALRSLLRGAA